MSEKRVADDTVDDSPCKKRGLTIQTVKKWVTEHEKELMTILWLTYDRLHCDHMSGQILSMSDQICHVLTICLVKSKTLSKSLGPQVYMYM